MAVQQNHFFYMPSEHEAELLAASGRVLAACTGQGGRVKLRLIDDAQKITAPIKAIHIFADILNLMAEGTSISITPIHAEQSTQEATDFLNVSRQYLISQILATGKLAFHMAGNRRKMYFKDLMEYKDQQKSESQKTMKQLAQLSQEMGFE